MQVFIKYSTGKSWSEIQLFFLDYKELAFKWKEFNGIITTIINTVSCFNSMLIKNILIMNLPTGRFL